MALVLKSNSAFAGDIKDMPYRYIFDGVDCDTIVGCNLMKSSYEGALMRVTRVSDSATLDVMPKNGKYLDEQFLIDFAAGSDLTVEILYDQSGKGNHFLRSDIARQPFLIKAGVLQRDTQGLPAIKFDEGNQALVCRNLLLGNATGVGSYFKGEYIGSAFSNNDKDTINGVVRGEKSIALVTYLDRYEFIYKSSDTDKAEKKINLGGVIGAPNTIKTYINATASTFSHSINGVGATTAIVFTQMPNLKAVAIGTDSGAFANDRNMRGLFSAMALFSSPETANALL